MLFSSQINQWVSREKLEKGWFRKIIEETTGDEYGRTEEGKWQA